MADQTMASNNKGLLVEDSAVKSKPLLAINESITLTETEQTVFDILLDAARLNGPPGLVVRAAGGWVRDKLLGTSSDDIDIVVDRISGEEFAHTVSKYMTETAKEGCSRIGVVKQNPDQSKHLATACFTVHGVSLDVNHLRTETYTTDSRIPQVAMGTASEDAHRRDFTFNALFYNLNSKLVEDFVGSGVDDLRAGVIRTPLPPKETFEDDPLRMLRAIRFAARLGFSLDGNILEAMRMPSTPKLLIDKVSRERVGIEVDKMFSAGGSRPCMAAQLLKEADMLGAVFLVPEVETRVHNGHDHPPSADNLAIGVARAHRVVELLGADASKQDGRLATYAAILSPWSHLRYLEKSRSRPFMHLVIRGGLRLPSDLADMVAVVNETAIGLSRLSMTESRERRLRTGEHLRTLKDQWPVALALSVVLTQDSTDMQRVFAESKQWIEASGLSGCWTWRPYIDGKRLMEPPFSIPKGKRLGTLIEAQIRWRMEDPSLDAATCEKRMLEEAQRT